MMTNFKTKSVLIYDYGLFPELAVRLSKDFGKVWYFCHWQNAFPKSDKALIGQGLEGVERIQNFWDYIDKADLIIFPDTHCADLVEYLKAKGYPVAGVGKAEMLELDRWKSRQIQKQLGLPTQHTIKIVGLDALRDYLKDKKNKFIKINIYRGELETARFIDYKSFEPLLDHIAYEFGAKKNTLEFIVEEEVGELEPGTDIIQFNDRVLSPVMLGWESKGIGYLVSVVPYNDLPKQLKEVHDKFNPIFKQLQTKFFISTEIRVEGDKGYLIDWSCRFAAPLPSAIQLELIKNYSEVIWGLGHNQLVQPVYKAKYAGGVSFESEWAENHWLAIDFPPEMRQWVKLRMACKFNNTYYAVPGFSSVASVIALGNSPEEVINQVKERSEEIKAYLLDKNLSGLDEIMIDIQKGKKLGLTF